MIGTITASGHALPPYNVLRIPKRVKWEHMQNSNYGVIIANESGYVTQEIKKEYVEWLLGQFKKTDKKLLLVDNHISNYFFDEKKLCDENNLIIMTFPSNLTHILQPLDLVLFSSFSQHLSNLLRDGLKDNPKFKVNDKHYQMLAYHAWSSSFNSSNIRMSWIKSAEKVYLKGNRYSREQRDCSGKCSSHDPKRTGYTNLQINNTTNNILNKVQSSTSQPQIVSQNTSTTTNTNVAQSNDKTLVKSFFNLFK
ncbi:hypothetical protein PPL_11636 [Heterostelium album PN500]|uniref:DDE-1 domain-containing protein n=1 Tax=Heterostelium pallidum (strain ATCC 26659 / Pp 5 / PN500) TaxID=670386 RepID=D3BVB0_HETP5|nr:hypothetical protein PPL_11636 [Heterostelium album PN500]EFA74667.1 hypothetical protein PPL_11636 [Heterostelium album PN500]|eukprot:XP_020426801.1 hypothetical protein PPL_11636 [Heterostelium album PN500]